MFFFVILSFYFVLNFITFEVVFNVNVFLFKPYFIIKVKLKLEISHEYNYIYYIGGSL